MEIRTEMVPIEVDKACSCTIGRMRPTASGIALLGLPPLYPHACNRCGKREDYKANYPHIEYEPAVTITAGH